MPQYFLRFHRVVLQGLRDSERWLAAAGRVANRGVDERLHSLRYRVGRSDAVVEMWQSALASATRA